MSYKPGFYYLNAVTNQLIWRPLVVIKTDPGFANEPHIYQSWIVNFKDEYEEMISEVDEIVVGRIIAKEKERKKLDNLRMHASVY